MPNVINEMVVRELTNSFEGAEGMIVVSLSGLTVAETEGLRDSLAEKGVRLRMVRNRLARRALGTHGIEPPEGMLAGNVAMAWGGPEDAINAAKVLDQSEAKKQGKVAFRGGLLEGNLLGPEEAGELAKLPGREELQAKMLGTIIAPAQQLVGLLNANQGALARVLQARVDEGGEADD